MLYLHGLAAVLTDFDPHDSKTRNGKHALGYVIEQMADKLSLDIEKLMDATSGREVTS
ncbi:hypothetical protein [Sedimentitalea todarodis]|uniref:Uncharacterized protein n=1 Tax=Sedimentitalea todarodis TaxID=1631240 RepID=A0ABU3VCY6_9RHOB|nr:hypothetical protein [Sedimentitalea todarodis]MDU9004042.1 hypothetical protein [Sedimentitalea todarodis]